MTTRSSFFICRSGDADRGGGTVMMDDGKGGTMVVDDGTGKGG